MNKVFYPDLKIIPFEKIKLQEYFHKLRAKALANKIKKQGILRNPPIITQFNGGFLHLDGATRISAIQLLGYNKCLAQIVDYGDRSQVQLTSWSHIVKVNKNEFLKQVENIDKIEIKKRDTFSQRMLLKPSIICLIVFLDGDVFEVCRKGLLVSQVRALNTIVSLYEKHEITRVFSASSWNLGSVKRRFELHPHHNFFITFPTFSPQQILKLVDQDIFLPTGVSRHVVFRRKLNVNLPLSYLKYPVKRANEALQKFLQPRPVRLYEEPVIYFE